MGVGTVIHNTKKRRYKNSLKKTKQNKTLDLRQPSFCFKRAQDERSYRKIKILKSWISKSREVKLVPLNFTLSF